MLLRYWSWTSSSGAAATSSVPFGPLRYRQWTSGAGATAQAGLPFGPLRYRAWTSGPAIVVIPPLQDGAGLVYRVPVPDALRRLKMEDEELLWLVIASAVASGIIR